MMETTKLNPNELNADAVSLAQTEVLGASDTVERWLDHLETKVSTLFGLGALLLGVVPTLGGVQGSVQGWLLGVAGVSWLVVAVASFIVLGPTRWFSLTPAKLLTTQWLTLDARAYQLYRTEFLVETLAKKRIAYARKRHAFGVVLVGLAVEVLALTALVLAGVSAAATP